MSKFQAGSIEQSIDLKSRDILLEYTPLDEPRQSCDHIFMSALYDEDVSDAQFFHGLREFLGLDPIPTAFARRPMGERTREEAALGRRRASHAASP